MGDTPVKVLHVGPKNYPPNHGGVEKVVFDLVTGMKDIESHVFTQWDSSGHNSNVHQLRSGLRASLNQVVTYCRANGVAVVHLPTENFIPLALLLRVRRIKCVVTIHGCGWRLKRWALYYRIPIFLLDCLACLLSPCVVFVGQTDRVCFQRLFPFRRLHFIPNGVVVSDDIAVPGIRKGMVYLGRLSPEKNIAALIEAAESAGVSVDLYGPLDRHDSQFRRRILERLESCEHVRWRGSVPFDRVCETISLYRCFVNVSHSEGLPVSVLEAAGEGLYLVLSDIPQHRTLDFPECTYVDPDNICFGALAADTLDGALNREHVRREFSAEKMVRAYREIYEGVT